MASSTDWFPQFSKLPPELRDQIWFYAFPEPRIYEVFDSPCSSCERTASAKLMFADIRNEPPPALARVCRDSRQAVLRYYKPLVFSGTVKHINLGRDILLLDSYLQVRRLLKVVRLLSQVDCVRRSASRIALGTSWGQNSGLHLRLLNQAVRTKPNMARFLQYLLKFPKLKALILVIYQRSAFDMTSIQADHTTTNSWSHQYYWEAYYCRFTVNFNLENYWARRPLERKLVQQDYETVQAEKTTASTRASKSYHRGTRPQKYDIQDLKETFEQSLLSVARNKCIPPKLETATVTWICTPFDYEAYCCRQNIP
ncbi:hypothetical protein F5B22DRAFT_531966 [Xylaria bambusicola]|uniref:uncharacterized protein n=1 Tax=Xylaria bambusicola TaxID=326684 RepID=UPI002008E48C|nr:uncharacterized protein F5B22DRAFT_531966 [Xylaria bambusicola]KAI0505280.1 hypothetical protein F5B22DRAFT_531966 [Xylaria bambusicola]